MNVRNNTPNLSSRLRRTPIIVIIALLGFGCGTDLEWEEHEAHQPVLAQSTNSLTPMWGTKPVLKKFNGKLSTRRPRGRTTLNDPTEHNRETETDWVRETGFRTDEAGNTETELVRETGFMPTPRLTLVAVEDGAAHLSWTNVANVAYYRLNGRVHHSETDTLEQHGTSYILRGTETSILLDGNIWEFRVTAVGTNKARRSKPSNRVQADPNAE